MTIGKGEAAAQATITLLVRTTPVWVALFSDDDTTTEIAPTGYARALVPGFSVPAGQTSTNTASVELGPFGTTVSVESVALMTAASGGAVVYGASIAATSIPAGDTVRFQIGTLTVQEL